MLFLYVTLDECYSILELNPGATAEDIKAAYVDLVKVWHPDRYSHESTRLKSRAEEKLKAINRAYEILRAGKVSKTPRRSQSGSADPPVNPEVHLSPMRFGDLWGYVNADGKLVIRPKWDVAEVFAEGLAHVVELGRHGFINQTGQYHIVPQFARARNFSQGLAAVVYNTKWAFVDRSGKCAITPLYDDCQDFSGGLAGVLWRGRWGIRCRHVTTRRDRSTAIGREFVWASAGVT
jgi:hypothetical protein